MESAFVKRCCVDRTSYLRRDVSSRHKNPTHFRGGDLGICHSLLQSAKTHRISRSPFPCSLFYALLDPISPNPVSYVDIVIQFRQLFFVAHRSSYPSHTNRRRVHHGRRDVDVYLRAWSLVSADS